MTSPGGKCNTCPCGTTGGAPMQPTHRAPTCCGPPQQQQQQVDSCQVQAPQIPTTCQVPQYQRPQVECTCTQNRVRTVRPQPIQANVVTCSRPVREPVIMEAPRCNCREMREAQTCPPQPKPCTCAPVQQPQPCHTTHVHMPCASNQVSTRGPVPYQRQPCAHCRSTNPRKKKCVIQ